MRTFWRRKHQPDGLLHSDRVWAYIRDDWRRFLAAHGLVCSISRRGNCHDNVPVAIFFGLLKCERIRRQIYPT